MRGVTLVCWLMLPILVAAYHYGPGQERMRLDDVARVLGQADSDADTQNWGKAAAGYDEALRLLPSAHVVESRRIRLKRDQAQMLARQLPEAHADLKALVEELVQDPAADKQMLAQARTALASAQYYMTWLMRLEGAPKEIWEPEIEAARQEHRLLAEEAQSAGDTAAASKHREDLEATIRLARMDLNELQGLPLPSQ